MKRRRLRREGMTLIEILVVLVIMAAMASAVGYAMISYIDSAHKRESETRARTLQSASIAYLLESPGECPSVDDLLERDIIDKTTNHKDGWGRPFSIDCEGSTVHVRSGGKDGELGTSDDVGF